MAPLLIVPPLVGRCAPQPDQTQSFAGKSYVPTQGTQWVLPSTWRALKYLGLPDALLLFFFSGAAPLHLRPWDGIPCRTASSLLPNPTGFSAEVSTPSLSWTLKEIILLFPEQNMCQPRISPRIKCLFSETDRKALLKGIVFGVNQCVKWNAQAKRCRVFNPSQSWPHLEYYV